MNDDKESIIVEADTFDEFKNEASIVTAVKEQIEAAQEASSLNSVPGVQPLVTDPNRDTFFDWISAFLKPNQPSSPVLPIGDPPENCPPCGKVIQTHLNPLSTIHNHFFYRVRHPEQDKENRRRRRSRSLALSMDGSTDVRRSILLWRCINL